MTNQFSATETRYRQQIIQHYNHLTMTGLPERQSGLNSVPLEKVFVKLNTEIAQVGRLDRATQQERSRLERELDVLRQQRQGESEKAQILVERMNGRNPKKTVSAK